MPVCRAVILCPLRPCDLRRSGSTACQAREAASGTPRTVRAVSRPRTVCPPHGFPGPRRVPHRRNPPAEGARGGTDRSGPGRGRPPTAGGHGPHRHRHGHPAYPAPTGGGRRERTPVRTVQHTNTPGLARTYGSSTLDRDLLPTSSNGPSETAGTAPGRRWPAGPPSPRGRAAPRGSGRAPDSDPHAPAIQGGGGGRPRPAPRALHRPAVGRRPTPPLAPVPLPVLRPAGAARSARYAGPRSLPAGAAREGRPHPRKQGGGNGSPPHRGTTAEEPFRRETRPGEHQVTAAVRFSCGRPRAPSTSFGDFHRIPRPRAQPPMRDHRVICSAASAVFSPPRYPGAPFPAAPRRVPTRAGSPREEQRRPTSRGR